MGLALSAELVAVAVWRLIGVGVYADDHHLLVRTVTGSR